MATQPKSFNRREFLKLAAMSTAGAAVTLSAAGCSSGASAGEGKLANGGAVEFTKEADVVIVGSGISGLFAAYATAKAGLKTLIIEKSATYGGDSMLAAGVMPVHATAAMKQQGIADGTPDEWLEKYKDYFDKQALPEFQRGLFWGSLNSINILTEELGVEWAPFQEGYTYYFHIPSGGLANMFDVLNPLYNHVTNNGVETMFDSKAVNFILDENDETVGVRIEDQVTKEFIDIRSKRIILSTGDFVSNQAMVSKHLPNWATAGCASNTSMGEGLDLAQSVGGDLINMDTYGPMNSDNGQIVVWGWYGPIVDVTPDGKRFVNEKNGHHVSESVHELGFHHWYTIFDDKLANGPLSMSVEAVGKLGRIVKADTIEELAALINIRTENLVETIDRYNALAETGEDTDFGKDLFLEPLTAPFYAAFTFPVRYKSDGGVRVDTSGQLVDAAGTPIANIYAAGSCCGSVSPNLNIVAGSGLYVAGKVIESLA